MKNEREGLGREREREGGNKQTNLLQYSIHQLGHKNRQVYFEI